MKDYSKISNEDGEVLVKTARQVVTEYLKNRTKIKLEQTFESNFSYNSGVFVTLNNPMGLRGCVGFALPDKKLYNALVDAAISAATEDPRFPPVTAKELEEITFEVTVLTPPEVIHVSDTVEYPSRIKVGKDGLIVKHGSNSGLLLPQVPVEYSWTEEEFLGYACEKAGLPRDCWKDKETEVQKFEGIVFKEETPNGRVVRE
ncbi:MAG: TIGR00296 family protein [Thaumarchaeota archaeon]|nr:TIGR00296 family protein [Nitrososphaerota archaeon]